MPYTPPSRQSSVSSTSTTTLTITTPSNPYESKDLGNDSATNEGPSSNSFGSSYSNLSTNTESTSSSRFMPTNDGSSDHHDALVSQEQLENNKLDLMSRGKESDATKAQAIAGDLRPSKKAMFSLNLDQSCSEEDEPAATASTSRYEELEKAVRNSIHLDRGGSPDREQSDNGTTSHSHRHELDLPKPGALSPSARKISHSRSSTDGSIMRGSASTPDLSSLGSDGSEDDELDSGCKPSRLRKKSGELVKPAIRPSNRRKVSSMPGTPTYSKKGVHFDDHLQQVKHFLQVDRPIAVSAGGSPVAVLDDEQTDFPFSRQNEQPCSFSIRLGEFPRNSRERLLYPVRLERLYLSHDQKRLVGSIAVANIAFHKAVAARFTFDNWKTVSEVTAAYCGDLRRGSSIADGFDMFNFYIELSDQAHLDKKTMFLCIRYSVNGQDYWDNNDGINFRTDFVKTVSQDSDAKAKQSTTSKPIPRSRHNSPSSQRLRSSPSIDDDFADGLDARSNFRMGPIPPKKQVVPDTPPRRQNHSGQPFGNRYDFGASLTAALSHAQSQLGDRSGLTPKPGNAANAEVQGTHGEAATSCTSRIGPARQYRHASGTDSPRTDSLMSTKQSVDSRAYQEFVSKFCFVSSSYRISGVLILIHL